MKKVCFICKLTVLDSTKQQKEQIHYFKTPVHQLSTWKKKINADNLSLKSHFCSSHFENKYIKKFTRLGQECWKLSCNAEPTLLLCEQDRATNTNEEPKPLTNNKSTTKCKSPAGTFLNINNYSETK